MLVSITKMMEMMHFLIVSKGNSYHIDVREIHFYTVWNEEVFSWRFPDSIA